VILSLFYFLTDFQAHFFQKSDVGGGAAKRRIVSQTIFYFRYKAAGVAEKPKKIPFGINSS